MMNACLLARQDQRHANVRDCEFTEATMHRYNPQLSYGNVPLEKIGRYFYDVCLCPDDEDKPPQTHILRIEVDAVYGKWLAEEGKKLWNEHKAEILDVDGSLSFTVRNREEEGRKRSQDQRLGKQRRKVKERSHLRLSCHKVVGYRSSVTSSKNFNPNYQILSMRRAHEHARFQKLEHPNL